MFDLIGTVDCIWLKEEKKSRLTDASSVAINEAIPIRSIEKINISSFYPKVLLFICQGKIKNRCEFVSPIRLEPGTSATPQKKAPDVPSSRPKSSSSPPSLVAC
jgi:hypothetical protein